MKKILAAFALVLLPVVASAQNTVDSVANSAGNTIGQLTNIINKLIPFFLAIAVVVFIYGVIRYVVASSPDDKAAGRSYIIWGIIGIAVILSIFGLVKLLQNTVGISDTTITRDDLPVIPTGTANTVTAP
jgi:hypothetical protein